MDVEEKQIGRKDAKLQLTLDKTDNNKMESLAQQYIENIDLTIETEAPPKFYYYKRWLWMIFPWVIFFKSFIKFKGLHECQKETNIFGFDK